MSNAAALDESSKQAGVAVERYQTLTQGLLRLGVAPQQADSALRALNNTLVEVQSGTAAKGATAALDKMGVSSKILSGEITTADGLLDAIATSSKKFGTEAQFTAALIDVLGKSAGQDLATALQDGGVALRQQEEDVRAAGAVIKEEYVQALNEAQKQIDDFTLSMTNKITIWAGVSVAELQRVARNFQIVQEGSRVGGGESYLGGLIISGRRMPKGGKGGGRSAEGTAFRYLADREDASGEMGATEKAAAKAEEERLKREKAAKSELAKLERERAKELRAAESAREKALVKELELLRRQGEAAEDLLNTAERLRGSFTDEFDELLRQNGANWNPQTSILTDTGLDALQDSVDDLLVKAGYGAEKIAKTFENEGIKAAQAIAQIFGGKVGNEISKMAGVLRGLSTGDFSSVGGKLGGAATLIAQDKDTRKALKEAFSPVVDGLESTFDDLLSSLGMQGGAGNLVSSGLAGFGIGSALGGNTESGIGGAIGGMAGSTIGMAVGGPVGAAIGQAVGSILGSGIGGLFAGAKKGSVTLGSSNGEFTVGAATGNSASRRANASELGGSVVDTLNSIAKELGAGIGSFAVSVGQRDGVFSVDPTGRGMVSKKYGAVQFDTAEEAARYAIQDAIKDGAFTGLSQTVVNALRNAGTLEQGLDDAVLIQSVAKRLAQIDDPVGAAIDALNDEFEDLRDTLIKNGATVAELADAERLYNEERANLLEASIATLKEFQSSLNVGSGSPLSLTDQQAAAQKAFAAFESDILAGRDIDQAAYTQAAQDLLDVTRQIDGGTAGFFAQFDRVQSLTAKAISDLENVSAIREGPFAQKTAESTAATADSTAALLNAQNSLIQQVAQIAALLSAGGSGSGYDAAALAGYVRAA